MSVEMLAARWKAVPTVAVLNRDYDAMALAAEVESLRAEPWIAQRPPCPDGAVATAEADWNVLPLRSPGGDASRTDPGGAGPVGHADTPHLARAPHLAKVLSDLPAPLQAARLLSLGPGAEIREHRDVKRGLPWGLARFHIPIITNPGAVMVVDGREYHWDAGRLWFGDFDRPHHERNTGPVARVHLVVDSLVSPELLELFPAEFRESLPDGEVLLARPARPGPCPPRLRFRMPARFREWFAEHSATVPDTAIPAEITSDGDGPALHLDGTLAFGLVHLGDNEYRFTGWSEERTMKLEPHRVTCRVRRGATVHETTCLAEPA